MASFVHIADKRDEKSILRNGIKPLRRRWGIRGVFALPVVPDFAVTHQWARELKKSGARALVCVQFRLPDREPVLVGRYNGPKVEMPAARALDAVLKHSEPMGLEVVIARKILPKELTRLYPAPALTGWRYYPQAKGRQPCRCKFCSFGEIRAQRLIGPPGARRSPAPRPVRPGAGSRPGA